MSNIWMMVSFDEYELPLAVAESATELAEMVGANRKTIMSAVSHVRHGRQKRSVYVKVEIDDTED